MVKCGFKPQLHNLDNESPRALKTFMTEMDEKYQLKPAYIHGVNASKWTIRTWKNHFTERMCSIDPNLPLRLYYRLMQQAYITLNMLRIACMNPKTSAYELLEGHFY